jgi:hypothetical protein
VLGKSETRPGAESESWTEFQKLERGRAQERPSPHGPAGTSYKRAEFEELLELELELELELLDELELEEELDSRRRSRSSGEAGLEKLHALSRTPRPARAAPPERILRNWRRSSRTMSVF